VTCSFHSQHNFRLRICLITTRRRHPSALDSYCALCCVLPSCQTRRSTGSCLGTPSAPIRGPANVHLHCILSFPRSSVTLAEYKASLEICTPDCSALLHIFHLCSMTTAGAGKAWMFESAGMAACFPPRDERQLQDAASGCAEGSRPGMCSIYVNNARVSVGKETEYLISQLKRQHKRSAHDETNSNCASPPMPTITGNFPTYSVEISHHSPPISLPHPPITFTHFWCE
jgi:hypothetical protein